ncbi:hypothetical protein, partial [Streptococcus pneumoniae]|uniref:hypothetical protein n=1 Tax=Streptococcus pneumoniae TaxID=1313 RepID=UPI001E62ED1D
MIDYGAFSAHRAFTQVTAPRVAFVDTLLSNYLRSGCFFRRRNTFTAARRTQVGYLGIAFTVSAFLFTPLVRITRTVLA